MYARGEGLLKIKYLETRPHSLPQGHLKHGEASLPLYRVDYAATETTSVLKELFWTRATESSCPFSNTHYWKKKFLSSPSCLVKMPCGYLCSVPAWFLIPQPHPASDSLPCISTRAFSGKTKFSLLWSVNSFFLKKNTRSQQSTLFSTIFFQVAISASLSLLKKRSGLIRGLDQGVGRESVFCITKKADTRERARGAREISLQFARKICFQWWVRVQHWREQRVKECLLWWQDPKNLIHAPTLPTNVFSYRAWWGLRGEDDRPRVPDLQSSFKLHTYLLGQFLKTILKKKKSRESQLMWEGFKKLL